MERRLRPAVFLDRDGTLIEDRHYLSDPEGVVLLPGAGEAVARLNRAGLLLLLVTNQSGIGRGYFTEEAFAAVQARLAERLADRGARLDAVYHCPHAPDVDPPCDCRKPSTGLFVRAAREHGVDLRRSFLIGDRSRDVEPARELGATGILVRTGPDASEPVPPGAESAASLTRAAERILARRSIDLS